MSETNDSIHLSLIIPAYNEALRLPPTLTRVLEYLSAQPFTTELIIVDDGSSDGTGEV
ncbi:MAG: glycosyltransferase, partial [Armatimonadia bacterium]